jgi:hypothetical protein
MVDQYKYSSDLTYAMWLKILAKIEELQREAQIRR